ncbi:MAG: hypothetical protein ACE5K0_07795 [Candidatus Methanofastidiosia archaeon]
MRILPEDKRERKWFIGIVIILILWWPFVLFYDIDFLFLWDQPSPIPYIIFGLFVGLISKMKMNSLIFSVCSLFDAALREKFFTRS